MNFVTVLIALVMFIALVGMIVCSKKQKSSPIAQPIAIVLLIVVIACGVGILYRTDILGSPTNRFQAYENTYHKSQGFVLGKYIQANFPDKKVLILLEADYNTNPRTQILVDGLKEGAGANLDTLPATLELANRPNNPEAGMEMPLFEVMTAADFDKAVDTYKDCGVIISSIGLPRDTQKMKLWTQKDDARPKVLLLNAFDMRGYDKMIERGFISAIVAVGPDAKFTEDAPPRDLQAAFDVRYVLIDKSNAEKYANMFR